MWIVQEHDTVRLARLRFTLGHLMAAVAIVSVALGGYLWMTKPPKIEVRRAPQPLRANVDHEIFDIVLSDLLVDDNFGPTAKSEEGKPKQIVLSALTEEGYPEDPESIGEQMGKFISDKKMDRDVLHDSFDRNPPKVRFSLVDYRPSNPSILVRDLKDNYRWSFHELNVGMGWVEVLLPGYSKDGQTALLRFGFGPTAHGAEGYYLLKKAKGHWEIIDKGLWFYV
jgi:hypothetical protein